MDLTSTKSCTHRFSSWDKIYLYAERAALRTKRILVRTWTLVTKKIDSRKNNSMRGKIICTLSVVKSALQVQYMVRCQNKIKKNTPYPCTQKEKKCVLCVQGTVHYEGPATGTCTDRKSWRYKIILYRMWGASGTTFHFVQKVICTRSVHTWFLGVEYIYLWEMVKYR